MKKKTTAEIQPDSSWVLQTELQKHWEILFALRNLWLFYPGFDFWVQEQDFPWDTGLSQWSYVPQFYLEFSRSFSSRWQDLLIPCYLKGVVLRNFLKKDDSQSTSLKWNLLVKNTAVNLFGLKGAYPFFKFYDSDEWGQSFNAETAYASGTLSGRLYWQQWILWTWANNSSLQINHSSTWQQGSASSYTDQSKIQWKWNLPVKEKIQLPWFSESFQKRFDKNPILANNESIQIQLEQGTETLRVQIFLGHETSLQFPDFGMLRAYLQTGLLQENLNNRTLTESHAMAGLQAGVELQVQF